jgi:trk system potassium uptake protein TrkH
VNYGIVLKVLGALLLVESVLMAPALLISVYLGESSAKAFLFTIVLMAMAGSTLMSIRNRKGTVKAREGLVIVALGWVVASLFGALPLYLTASVPTFVDALFETISGFTTTGSSVIADVESLSRGILFWRSFTHWIGGMGILVFTLALLPALGIGGMQIFKAESPGPVAGKIAPRIKDTAKVLYVTYFIITVLEISFLMLGGVSLYDASLLTFGTVGTGGLGIRNDSIAGFSTYVQVVIGVFMILAGANFSLYFLFYKKKFKEVLQDGELRLYLKFIFAAVILITLNLVFTFYDDALLALRDAFFQVSSIITTTGFTTVDFHVWPTFSKMILLVLMFIGGSAGSTAGGMKVIRLLVVFKLIKRELSKTFHPRAIIPVKVGGKVVSNDTIAGINSFMALHLIIFIVGTILIAMEGVDFDTAISSVAATLNNIGPGFGLVGPTQSYMGFTPFSKIVFSLLMLLGRLELFTIIALLVPKSWTRES